MLIPRIPRVRCARAPALAAACACACAAALPSASSGQVTVGQNFKASTLFVESNSIPPDTMGAVGIDHYVETINGRYSVYRKSDGARVQTGTFNSFWGSAGVSVVN